ncbi:MAG: hypothetical protein ACTMIR_03435 [Cellulomonadaceae bacterium]
MPRRPGHVSPIQQRTVVVPRLVLSSELPRGELAARIHSGELRKVRRGTYVAIDPAQPEYEQRRTHAFAHAIAVAQQSGGAVVFSHTTAAMFNGLPLPGLPTATHVIQRSTRGGTNAPDTVRHTAALPADQITEHRGLLITTLERTVVDCARALSPLAGLIIADAALHVGADRELCMAILKTMTGRRGVIRAREILRYADDGAESPGETRMRFQILRAGFPVPETQIQIRTSIGDFWADLGWREWRLLAEYDGKAKYTAQGTATEAVLDERRRERAIEQLDWTMARAANADLHAQSEFHLTLLRHTPEAIRRSLKPRPLLAV